MNPIHTDLDQVATQADAARDFRLVALDGDRGGEALASGKQHAAIGSHPSNDVVIEDRLVSRFHCELRATSEGVIVHDAGSRNGTYLDGVRVTTAHARDGSVLRVGRVALRVELETGRRGPRLSRASSFGRLVGTSPAMRGVFAVLEQAAPTDATVLVEGESGTGKELVAESLHAASARARGPLVVVDCGSLPAGIIESELFGHERGAFTGASGTRVGAFEAANGGTIFLDEIGELPLELQSRLLRALESRTVQRVGASTRRSIDVRVVAATNRDLRAEVNERRFRGDLYHRLAVVRVRMPPLRERPEDLPALVRHLLHGLGAREEQIARIASPESIARLTRAAWPGNVRELRNHLESALVLGEMTDVLDEESRDDDDAGALAIDPSVPFVEARRRAIADFERRYVRAVVGAHGGDVAEAARACGVDRTYLYRILRRHRDND